MILTAQFILSIILLTNNFYKKHSLYKEPKIKYVHNLNFYPILTLYGEFYYGRFHISYDRMKIKEFSLIKSEKFSTKCLENYYIYTNETCPITEIKITNRKFNEYNNYIRINNYKIGNQYIYYTNENKNGKLYKSFNYSDFLENKKDIFSLDEIARKEFNKLSNPIFEFKSYIKFCDLICLILIILSFLFTIIGYCAEDKSNLFEYTNALMQIFLFILYLIRFFKFIEVKKFFFANEDIYKTDEESYFPHKMFNIDSFPLAFSLNYFVFIFFYYRFQNKKSCYYFDNVDEFIDVNLQLAILFWTLLFLYILFAIFGIIDEKNIKKCIIVYF